MSNETKNKIVSKLRFREFEGGGKWIDAPLGSCLLHHPDYGINAPAVPYSNSLPTYLRITDISEDGHFLRNQMVSVEEKVTEDNYLDEGDIVFARTGASVGKSYKYRKKDGKLVFAGFLIRVKPDKKKLNSEFLFQFLSTEKYWRWVNFTSARSGQPGINGNEYSSMPISLPPTPDEQQKIADCLYSLDELITAQTKKKEMLNVQKNGLIQQLFPAEGESKPLLRFAEYSGSGEWHQKSLESLSTKISDGIHTTPIYDESGEYFFINGNNLVDGKIILDEKTKKVSEEEFIKHKRDLNQNTVLLSINGTIGNISIYANEKIILGKSACYINVNDNYLIKSFLFYYMQTDIVRRYFDSELTGSTIKNLSLRTVKNTIIHLPSIQEQKKIADCLSSLDELITSQTEKIEQLKNHKKGLLLGLFPNVNEVNL